MAFSSLPAYLDSSNWQQQQNHHQIIGSSGGGLNPLLPAAPQHLSGPHPLTHGGGGGTGGSIRPGSMAERARLANIPLPEPALECPRCESTNTKFCYFNNYNLSQPRHFCKACRRYWTRGGALRSVPIGGGCRRNKKSKSSANSKSAVTAARQTIATNITENNNNNNNISTTAATMLGLLPLRFMSPLSQFTEDLVGGDHQMGFNTYSGITATTPDMNYNGGGGSHFLRDGKIMSSGSVTNIEPWQLQHQQQFPFMGVLDQSSSPGIYQFQGGHPHHQVGGRPKFLVGSIKTEERPPQELNLSKQLGGELRPQALTNQRWNNNSNNNSDDAANWTGFSSFNSSSTSKLL